MRCNCNYLDLTRQFAKKDGERETLEAEPAQCRRTSDWKAVRRLTNVLEGGGNLGKIARTKTGLLRLVLTCLRCSDSASGRNDTFT